jgi:hypothetical protein
VGVGESKTDRISPCFVGLALSSAQLKTQECITGRPLASASTMPATARQAEVTATNKSRRVIMDTFDRENRPEVKRAVGSKHRLGTQRHAAFVRAPVLSNRQLTPPGPRPVAGPYPLEPLFHR